MAVKPESREFIKDWIPGSGAENFVVSAIITARKPLGVGATFGGLGIRVNEPLPRAAHRRGPSTASFASDCCPAPSSAAATSCCPAPTAPAAAATSCCPAPAAPASRVRGIDYSKWDNLPSGSESDAGSEPGAVGGG